MSLVATQRTRFGPFELDAHAGELYKHDLKLKLQGHPIQILAMLLERPGNLITREEIQQKLWPSESETFVDFEHGLNTAVRKLRQTLGDEAETPQYIETLPRRGYRFVGEVADNEVPATPDLLLGSQSGFPINAVQPEVAADTQSRPSEATQGTKRLSLRPLIALALLATVLGAAWVLRNRFGRPAPLQATATKQITFNGMVGYGTSTVENYRSIQTDGRRIYFTTATLTAPLRSVAVNGGEETTIPTSFKEPVILHLSPNGEYLLVRNILGESGSPEAQLWLVATNGGATRRLGNIEAQDAAFAPDNKTIAFAKGQTLFLTDMQGTAPVKLAEVNGHPFWLRWSPNGQRLRFSVQEPKTLRSTLWELGPDQKLRQLFTDWEKGQEVCCGLWTADGWYFLFSSASQYWYVAEPIAQGSKPSMLTSGGPWITAAAANPLANQLFVTTTSPKWDVLAWDVKNDHTTKLYPQLFPFRLVYSPDGERVAYTKRVDRGYELWLARVDGTDRRQVSAARNFVTMTFSRDGMRIAFTSRQSDKPWKTYWGDVEGGVWHEIPGPPENQVDPNWSLDGQTILFGQPPAYMAEPGGERHLYAFDLRNGKTTKLEGTAGLFSPRWSPDGRYVIAMHADSKGMSVWGDKQSGWNPLFRHDVDNPFWSSDSEWVYFNGFYDAKLRRVRVRDGRLEEVLPIPLSDDSRGCFGNGFTPDGKVLLSCFDPRRNVYAMDLK